MNKPLILLVDPKPEVLAALKEDLYQKYQKEFRMLKSDSDQIALQRLKQLQAQNDSVTLFVVEQDSQMQGVEFFKIVMDMFPQAKPVLLTVYDTDDFPCQLPLPQAVIV